MTRFGFYIIPAVLMITVIAGYIKKIPVFDAFLEGAKEGINSTFTIAPSLIGLIVCVTMLKSSGAFDIFSWGLSPFFKMINIPSEVIPLALLRPISGSGSIAVLDNIFKNFGADSYIGKIASAIMGSTETTFYTLTVYFGSIGIKNSRHAVVSALLADITAIITATCLINILVSVGKI